MIIEISIVEHIVQPSVLFIALDFVAICPAGQLLSEHIIKIPSKEYEPGRHEIHPSILSLAPSDTFVAI